jgi:hypothetical protein
MFTAFAAGMKGTKGIEDDGYGGRGMERGE